MMVTHENILHTCPLVIDHPAPVVVSWLPQYHDMGLIGCYLYPALKGGTTYGFAPTDFIQRPVLWFDTINTYRATATAAPNFAYDYCLRAGQAFQGEPGRLRSQLAPGADVRRGTRQSRIPTRGFWRRFSPTDSSRRAFMSPTGWPRILWRFHSAAAISSRSTSAPSRWARPA